MSDSFLPYGRQSIDQSDIDAVARVLEADYLTTGPEVPAFEADFSKILGSDVESVACHSGTAALHLALNAFGIGEEHVCIVPSITFLATANAVRYCGAEVVFSDVDPDRGLMTPGSLDQALKEAERRFPNKRVGAILPVHLGGIACPLDRLHTIAKQSGALVIADSCHALGTVWTDAEGTTHLIGDSASCDAACFSFHPVKTIACGEGGMVTTSDPGVAAHMRRMRSHGMDRDPKRFAQHHGVNWPWYYEMAELGWNYRMPDINAALGRSQLAKLDDFAHRRRQLTAIYRGALADMKGLVSLPVSPKGVDACRHLMNVLIDFKQAGVSCEDVMSRLKDQQIGSQVHYIPVHQQPYYISRYGEQTLPGAESHYARTLSLPLYPSMSDADPIRVCEALRVALEI